MLGWAWIDVTPCSQGGTAAKVAGHTAAAEPRAQARGV